MLPELYNTRAEAMWEHISENVEVIDKTILDAGCGRGDIVMRAWCDGARAVYGIDNSKIDLNEARLRSWALVKEGAHIYFMNKDIESWSERWPGHHDIIICTSVLPYLVNPDKVLQNIYRDSDVAIIECQYAGDGPGFKNIADDKQMVNWLSDFGWAKIDKIGYTVVESRDMQRSIWRCVKDDQ